MFFRAYQAYVLDGFPIKPNGKNTDLLQQLVDLATQLGSSRLALLKVPAHEDRMAYATDLERWLVDGNHAMDKAAVVANQVPTAFGSGTVECPC